MALRTLPSARVTIAEGERNPGLPIIGACNPYRRLLRWIRDAGLWKSRNVQTDRVDFSKRAQVVRLKFLNLVDEVRLFSRLDGSEIAYVVDYSTGPAAGVSGGSEYRVDIGSNGLPMPVMARFMASGR